jgi:2-methylcitrate dehydratase PrpD
VRRVRKLIDVQVDPELESRYPELNGCHLSVTLNNGTTREAYLPNMKGEPEFRMSADELKAKFTVLTDKLLSAEDVDQIFNLCIELHKEQNIHKLIALTSAKQPILAN